MSGGTDQDSLIDQGARSWPLDSPLRPRLGLERGELWAGGARCVWLTGLSGAGKTTLAEQLAGMLRRHQQAVVVLDGDQVRCGLSRDLGFGREARAENMRRAAEVAKLVLDAGVMVIAAFISPFDEDRARVKAIVGATRYIEVFVDTPLAVCRARDAKGLYARAAAGEILGFTGVDAPYEPPTQPAIHLRTEGQPVTATAMSLWEELSSLMA